LWFHVLTSSTAYAKMQKDSKPTTALDAHKTKMVTCLDEVAVVRGSDVLSSQPGVSVKKGLIADIGTLVPGATLRLDSTAWRWDSSRTIYSTNLANTVADSTAGAFASPAEVAKAVKDYGRVKDASKKYDPAYTHYKVHKAYRHFAKKMKKIC
jgi:hypothetical protein